MSTSMNSAVKTSIVRKNEVQNKALASVLKHFKRKHRALVTMACGAGKTRVCFMTISSMKAAVSVIAVPTLGLVRQMQDDAVRWMPGEKFDKLLVCSTIRHGDVSESPEDYGLDVTTSPEVILEAISKASKKNRLLIVVTYQSFDKLEAAAKLAKKRRKNIEIGLLVADEAHNTAGESGKKMALCLSDRSVKINKRLFLTATRKVIGQNTKNPQNYNCMDDERVYGKNVFDLSFAEAIKLGITCDYEILNMEVNWKGDDAKKLNTKNYQKSQGRVEELARFLAREMKKNPGMRVFSFHTSVANADAFNKALLKYKVWSRCITGEMPLTERQAILDEFESSGGSRVICSVRVFGEGVDVPSVDTVVFTDPLTSPIQIAQMVGRGQRIEAGKDMLSVYLPVFHPNGTDDETAEKTAKCSYFKTALKVLRTMSDMDDRLVGEIKNGWDESKKESTGRTQPIFNQRKMSAGFASVVKSILISKVVQFNPKDCDEFIRRVRDEYSCRPSIEHNSSSFLGKTIGGWYAYFKRNRFRKTLAESLDAAFPMDCLWQPKTLDEFVQAIRDEITVRPNAVHSCELTVRGRKLNSLGAVANRFDKTLLGVVDLAFPYSGFTPGSMIELKQRFLDECSVRPFANKHIIIAGRSLRRWGEFVAEEYGFKVLSDWLDFVYTESAMSNPESVNEMICIIKNACESLHDISRETVIGGRKWKSWGQYVRRMGWGLTAYQIAKMAFDNPSFNPDSITEAISRLRNDHKRRPSFGEAPCGLTADRWEAIAKRLNTTVEVIMKRAWPDS